MVGDMSKEWEKNILNSRTNSKRKENLSQTTKTEQNRGNIENVCQNKKKIMI